jgi:hypothetical protein
VNQNLQPPCIFTCGVLSCSLKVALRLRELEIGTQHSANPMVSKSEGYFVSLRDRGSALLDQCVVGTVIDRTGISQSIHILQSLCPRSPLIRCEPPAVDQPASIDHSLYQPPPDEYDEQKSPDSGSAGGPPWPSPLLSAPDRYFQIDRRYYEENRPLAARHARRQAHAQVIISGPPRRPQAQ